MEIFEKISSFPNGAFIEPTESKIQFGSKSGPCFRNIDFGDKYGFEDYRQSQCQGSVQQ